LDNSQSRGVNILWDGNCVGLVSKFGRAKVYNFSNKVQIKLNTAVNDYSYIFFEENFFIYKGKCEIKLTLKNILLPCFFQIE
jgi:hypothetical protein